MINFKGFTEGWKYKLYKRTSFKNVPNIKYIGQYKWLETNMWVSPGSAVDIEWGEDKQVQQE